MKQLIVKLPKLIMMLLVIGLVSTTKVLAAGEGQVTIGKIDYEQLTMEVKSNGNQVIYYSQDMKTWSELEGEYNSVTGNYLMDISWVSLSEVDLYFKGDIIKDIQTVTLPAQEKSLMITFNKVDGDFTFENMEGANFFEWRKASDYHWSKVAMDESTQSYKNFLKVVETFRVKGAKIAIRIPQEIGLSYHDVGSRPSKEITVSITARAAAPAIKVNLTKLTLNTTAAMEYYHPTKKRWLECEKNMSISDLAPSVLYENGGKNVTLKIRIAETERSPYSKTTNLLIPGQSAAPVIGGITSDASFYYMNNQLTIILNKASSTDRYQYAIVKNGTLSDPTRLSWKSVTSTKAIKLNKTTAPEGAIIFIRKQGVDMNASKGIELALPSAMTSFTVKYPVVGA